ncbi:MAG: hypothetical protein GC158_03355 [Cyanobacteria bacterium RI_101]|nr:hypothetical protein [Cyanobacteria bacterium RI_101]
MSEIKPIQDVYVTVKGCYGVINQGDGYAIVNIYTGECIARNISSFYDCVRTLDILPPPPEDDELMRVIQGYNPKVQNLIKKYAPETRRVKKKSNILGYTWYKCYDKSGNVLGRVRGSSDDRYWQYGGLDDEKLR